MVNETVQQQVPITTTRMHSEVVSQQIPITTTRIQNEVVQQQVPVSSTRMVNEVVEQTVPIQVQRMETYQEKVMVPHTVQKPVTRKVARQKLEYVPEVVSREVPVEMTTYRDEIVTQDVIVRTPITEKIVNKVQVPERIARSVPVTETRMVARTRWVRIPIDAFGNEIVDYSVISGATTTNSPAVVTASGNSDKGSQVQPAGGVESKSAGKPAVEPKEEKKSTSEGDLPSPKAPGELKIGPAGDEQTAEKPKIKTLVED
jgi:hypothetical protein